MSRALEITKRTNLYKTPPRRTEREKGSRYIKKTHKNTALLRCQQNRTATTTQSAMAQLICEQVNVPHRAYKKQPFYRLGFLHLFLESEVQHHEKSERFRKRIQALGQKADAVGGAYLRAAEH